MKFRLWWKENQDILNSISLFLVAWFLWEKFHSAELVWILCLETFSNWSQCFLENLIPCPTLCDPMNCSMPGLPFHHQLMEPTQTHVHWVSDAIQPSHPLLSPSPPALNLPQHQGLFKWVSSLHRVAKVNSKTPVLYNKSRWQSMTTNTKIQVSEEDHQQHDIWFGRRKGEARGNNDQK